MDRGSTKQASNSVYRLHISIIYTSSNTQLGVYVTIVCSSPCLVPRLFGLQVTEAVQRSGNEASLGPLQ